MKRTIVYFFLNIIAIVVVINFFFGNGGVSDLITEKYHLTTIQIKTKEKELALLSQHSDLLSEKSSKNIDEYLVKHGYKPENTLIFRFVSSPSSQEKPYSTHLLTRLYLVCGILILSLFLGETCLYLLAKGAFRL
ncbi:MAG: hypothetical protein ACK4HQ_00750 [Brevinematales bacterium]